MKAGGGELVPHVTAHREGGASRIAESRSVHVHVHVHVNVHVHELAMSRDHLLQLPSSKLRQHASENVS